MKTTHSKRFNNHYVYLLIFTISMLFAITSASKFAKSCCVLTQEELDDMRGINENCPDVRYSINLPEKCMTCPKGTCRLDDDCICPDAFLESSTKIGKCDDVFRKKWPASAGLDDPDYKICSQPSKEPDPSNISCCSLTEDQLWELRGWKNCPHTSFSTSLDDKCSNCPSGTCRLNKKCYCPDGFLSSSTRLGRCRDSFSVSWPESIGREDVSQRSCKNQEKDEPAKTTSSNDSDEKDSSSSTTSGDDSKDSNASTDNGSKGGSSGSNQNVNVDVSSNEDNKINGNQESGGGLSSLEIIGIVTGIVASIVTVVGFVVQRKRKQKTVADMNPGV